MAHASSRSHKHPKAAAVTTLQILALVLALSSCAMMMACATETPPPSGPVQAYGSSRVVANSGTGLRDDPGFFRSRTGTYAQGLGAKASSSASGRANRFGAFAEGDASSDSEASVDGIVRTTTDANANIFRGFGTTTNAATAGANGPYDLNVYVSSQKATSTSDADAFSDSFSNDLSISPRTTALAYGPQTSARADASTEGENGPNRASATSDAEADNLFALFGNPFSSSNVAVPENVGAFVSGGASAEAASYRTDYYSGGLIPGTLCTNERGYPVVCPSPAAGGGGGR